VMELTHFRGRFKGHQGVIANADITDAVGLYT